MYASTEIDGSHSRCTTSSFTPAFSESFRGKEIMSSETESVPFSKVLSKIFRYSGHLSYSSTRFRYVLTKKDRIWNTLVLIFWWIFLIIFIAMLAILDIDEVTDLKSGIEMFYNIQQILTLLLQHTHFHLFAGDIVHVLNKLRKFEISGVHESSEFTKSVIYHFSARLFLVFCSIIQSSIDICVLKYAYSYQIYITYYLKLLLGNIIFDLTYGFLFLNIKYQVTRFRKSLSNLKSSQAFTRGDFDIINNQMVCLEELRDKVFDIYQIPMLMRLFNTLISLALATYTFIDSGNFVFPELIITFAAATTWVLLGYFEVMLLIHVTEEMLRKFSDFRRLVEEKAEGVDFTGSIYKKMELFYLRVLLSRRKFAVCRMFPFDWTIIYSVVATTCTYMVILTQLRTIADSN